MIKMINYTKLYEQYTEGKSSNEIARSLGVRAGTVIYHFKKRGFKLRTQKEAIANRPPELKDKISKTLKRKYKSGTIIQWATGLTKETDERVKSVALSKTGTNYYNWKGGKCVHPSGATRMSENGRQFWEHHKVWCIANNFPYIPKGLEIHHINLNPSDNRPENLVMLPGTIHRKLHAKLQLRTNPDRKYWGKNIHLRGKA